MNVIISNKEIQCFSSVEPVSIVYYCQKKRGIRFLLKVICQCYSITHNDCSIFHLKEYNCCRHTNYVFIFCECHPHETRKTSILFRTGISYYPEFEGRLLLVSARKVGSKSTYEILALHTVMKWRYFKRDAYEQDIRVMRPAQTK